MSITDHAGRVAHFTSIVVQKFDMYFSREHSLERLADIERGFDDWQRAYIDVWDEVAPEGRWLDEKDSNLYEPFLRNMAVCLTLFQLFGQRISELAGFTWGTHLSPRNSPTQTDLDALLPLLPSRARLRIIPDLTIDLLSSVTDITRLSPGFNCIPELTEALDSICASIGCVSTGPIRLRGDWGFEIEDINFASSELGTSVETIEDLVQRRLIVSVPLWNGNTGFPTFQFHGGDIRDDVAFVLKNVSDEFFGWRLALWLGFCVSRSRGRDWYETVLSARCLWKPDWVVQKTGEFDSIKVNRSVEEILSPLYRVTKREFTPFFFSAVRQLPTSPSSVSAPSGRFDLESGISDMGSLYMAGSPEASCFEVLDRELVLTLESVLERCLWECTPQEKLVVADMSTVSSEVQTSRNRMDTRDLALRMSDRHKGMKVGLRTVSAGNGYVFFGPIGAHLPAAAGLGVWSAKQQELMSSDALWNYVDMRTDDLADFPIMFRRFPED